MKTQIITCYSENLNEIAARTLPRFHAFADRWGFDKEIKIIPEENSVWGKIDMIREGFAKGFDRILWLDIDAAVMNIEFDLNTLPQEGVVLTADVNGLNSGIILINRSPKVEKFFFSVGTYYRGMFQGAMNAEQQAIFRASITYPYTDVVKYVPQRLINSYWQDDSVPHNDGVYQEGDFILHLAGTPHEKRIEIFNSVGLLG
jgi:galactosyl transferase GMA12/MNN10 family